MSSPGSASGGEEIVRSKKSRTIVASDDEDDNFGNALPEKVEGSDAKMKLTSKDDSKEEEEDDDHNDDHDNEDEDDDLFGGDDDEEEDEDAVRQPKKHRRKLDSASPSANVQDDDVRRRARSPSDSLASDLSVDPRELRETSADPQMGYRDGVVEEEREVQEASFSLPSLPVRRGAAHFFARLPNLLQYRPEEFDEVNFDEKIEDEMLQNREGIRIDDEGLRSLLTTSNTIRWRWTNKRNSEGVRIPQSNARVIRWSDGTSSLQLGSEFYDITTSSERIQSKPQSQTQSQSQSQASQQNITTASSSIVPPQPVQHLSHLFVKHDGQDQINVLQAEAPIVGNLMFRPTSISSESHQRLAKAVRQQRGALVKETVTKEDPELVKLRAEREEKIKRQVRLREQRKLRAAKGGADDEDDDAFWASAGRAVRRHNAVSVTRKGGSGVNAIDDDMDDLDDLNGDAGIVDDDDGFVVDDEDDDAEDAEGRSPKGTGDMEVDEPDEMDRMEAEMEKQEALRLANKANNAGSAVEIGSSNPAVADGGSGADANATAGRRRRIVEDSDDEE